MFVSTNKFAKMTLMYFKLVFLLVVGTIGLVNGSASDYFHICHRTDPNLDECVLKSVESFIPHLRIGAPELGFPRVDPLHIDVLPFKSGTDDSGVASNITNLSVWGVSDIEVSNVKAKLTKRALFVRMKLRVPRLEISANFEFDSSILFLQLKGSGNVQVNITDVIFDFTTKAVRIERNGEEYLKFEKTDGTLEIKDAHIELDGLFRDPGLDRVTSNIVNQNFHVLFDEIKTSVAEVMFQMFNIGATRTVEQYTLNELLPI